MLAYGRSEHECLPNLEQDMLIGDSSEHIFLLSVEHYLLIDGSSDLYLYLDQIKIY